jgi:polar amino acid transport system substrate-binding protein/glutamine transport system substrate-binding protein
MVFKPGLLSARLSRFGVRSAPLVLGLLFLGGALQAAAQPARSQSAIVVGTNPTFPPFETMENGEVAGFDIDAMRAMAKSQNLNITFRSLPFNGIIPSLQAGALDAAASGITINRERLQSVDFTDPYYRSGLSVLVKDGSKITGFADLKGHVIGTQKATSSVEYLSKHGMAEDHVKQFQDINGAYQALLNGGVDAVLFDNPVNVMFKNRHPGVKIVGDLLTGEYYGFAVSKKDPELVAKLNRRWAEIKKNGDYDRLFTKYFGGDMTGAVKGDMTAEQAAAGN